MKEDKANLDMNIAKALQEDDNFKEGANEYERIMEQAQTISEEITSSLISEIVKKTDDGDKANSFTLTTAISAVAKTLINLVSYVYNDEKEYLDTIKEARQAVIEKVIPALLNPQPCGECPECKVGNSCTNPKMDTSLLQTKSLPIVSASMIEYDLWNKLMYMYTEGKETPAEDEAKKEEVNHE